MSDSEVNKRPASPRDPTRRAKRPYYKLTVRYERLFEVQALSCGKIQTTRQAATAAGRLRSCPSGRHAIAGR